MRGLSPSNADRWVSCSASAQFSEPYHHLEDRSEAALEGEAAHEVAERMWKGQEVRPDTEASNGVLITQDMIEYARMFVDMLPPGAQVERKQTLPELDDMSGRIDAYFVDTENDCVEIYDYKYGHSPVNAYENWQLLCYASAFLDDAMGTFRLVVVQPRCYAEETSREWRLSYEEYTQIYLPRLKEALRNAKAGDPIAVPGPHCKYCPARRACQALRESALSAVDMVEGSYIRDLSPAALGYELRQLTDAQERLKARLQALEEQAIASIDDGHPVPGFTKEPRYGRSSWSIDHEALFSVGDALGIDLRKPSQPVTPNQAVKAGFDKKTVERYTRKPLLSAKLKPVDEIHIRSIFAQAANEQSTNNKGE